MEDPLQDVQPEELRSDAVELPQVNDQSEQSLTEFQPQMGSGVSGRQEQFHMEQHKPHVVLVRRRSNRLRGISVQQEEMGQSIKKRGTGQRSQGRTRRSDNSRERSQPEVLEQDLQGKSAKRGSKS